MISRDTGQFIDEDTHIKQSIADILTTPKGTRLMRRDYGSNLLNRVSRANTPSNKTAIIAETAKALQDWEPRIELKQVDVEFTDDNSFNLNIIFSKKSDPENQVSALVGV